MAHARAPLEPPWLQSSRQGRTAQREMIPSVTIPLRMTEKAPMRCLPPSTFILPCHDPSHRCDRCRTPLPDAFLNTPAPVPCPGCHAPLLARVFPAFARGGHRARPRGGKRRQRRGCELLFPSAQKGGRALRALRAVPVRVVRPGDRRPAPLPVVRGRPGGGCAIPGAAGKTVFANERTLYDQVALSLAVLPLLMWPLTLFCAPVAFYFAVRYWNSPKQGLIRRSRVRLVLAAVFALAEMAGWGAVRVLCVRRAHAHALLKSEGMPMPPTFDF